MIYRHYHNVFVLNYTLVVDSAFTILFMILSFFTSNLLFTSNLFCIIYQMDKFLFIITIL